VDNWPDDEDILSAREGLIISSIELGDEQGAIAAIDDILLNCIDDERIAKVVCSAAKHYSSRGKDLRARQVFEHFLDRWSNPDLEIWARAIEINAATVTADPNAINWLIADFAGDRRLAEVVSCVSERFYNRALDFERKGSSGQARKYFQRAAEGWETIVDRLPESPDRMSHACQMAGDCYRRLGQHQRALSFYQQIAENWPSYKRAWHAQYLIGYSYERLKKGGVTPKEEADAIIEAVYTQLLEAYPDCPAAKAASSWLRSNAAAGKGGRG
ncbi:MAG: tetratricopeptide repeat protein, partial [Gammaproteobacteria bacterium]|nr:tetratricopeptide repeat protein [Gammaproteobacteria bacterium]